MARLPALQYAVPVRRYERQSPGELLHMDTKKFGRLDKPGHRVTGDRTQNNPARWLAALHAAIGDHSRLGFSLMLADDTVMGACAFLLAALRYYKKLGRDDRTGDDEQRLGLQVAPLRQVVASSAHPANPNLALYAANQRQGRAIHSDAAAGVGLCL